MIKLLKYFIVTLLTLTVVSCAKPAEEFLHTDNTISSIWITPADDATRIVYGDIDEDTGLIVFDIPRTMRPYFPDSSRLKVRAIIGYDAVISPSLLGIKDLSSDLQITVTATQTGESRNYILRVQSTL